MKYFVFIPLLVFSAFIADAAVLSGPIVNPGNFHYYYLLTSQSWSNSEAEAVSLGGHLVTIDDAGEQSFVFTNFAAGSASHNLWIGMRRNPTNANVFIWASGDSVSYTHWAAGEPNNCGFAETKGMMYGGLSPAAGFWNDATEAGRSGCDNGDLAPNGVVEVDPIRAAISIAAINVCWNSISNHHYQVEYQSVATGQQWTPLGSPVLANGTNTCVTDALTAPPRFYRIGRLD